MAKRKKAEFRDPDLEHDLMVEKLRVGWDTLTDLSEKPGKRTLAAATKFMDGTYKWMRDTCGPTEAELFRTAPIQTVRPSGLVGLDDSNGAYTAVFQLLYSRLMYLRTLLQ